MAGCCVWAVANKFRNGNKSARIPTVEVALTAISSIVSFTSLRVGGKGHNSGKASHATTLLFSFKVLGECVLHPSEVNGVRPSIKERNLGRIDRRQSRDRSLASVQGDGQAFCHQERTRPRLDHLVIHLFLPITLFLRFLDFSNLLHVNYERTFIQWYSVHWFDASEYIDHKHSMTSQMHELMYIRFFLMLHIVFRRCYL